MFNQSLAFNRDARFCVFDFEAESLQLTNVRPFQLAWLYCSPTEILERHDHYILWNDLQLSKGSAEVTKFDWGLYKERAEDPKKVYELFAKYLYDPKVIPVCQNLLNYDCYVIRNFQNAMGEKTDYTYLRRSIDTRPLFLALQKGMKYDPSIPFINWQYKLNGLSTKGLKSSQLFMLNHFGITYDKAKLHEAMYDISMLFEIFKKILQQMEIPNLAADRSV